MTNDTFPETAQGCVELAQAMLSKAETMLANDEPIDLTPLNHLTQHLIELLTVASLQDRQALRPALTDLTTRLQHMHGDAMKKLESLKGELGGQDQRNRAATAYMTAPSAPKKSE